MSKPISINEVGSKKHDGSIEWLIEDYIVTLKDDVYTFEILSWNEDEQDWNEKNTPSDKADFLRFSGRKSLPVYYFLDNKNIARI
jgi:hypothetical protein